MPRFTHTRRRVVARLPIAALVMAVLASLGGCGLLGGSEDEPTESSGNSSLEKPRIKISIMPTTDLAPFHLAVKNGYFKEAGFEFDPSKDVVVARSGGESVTKLTSGEVDIAYSSYTPFFVAKAAGAGDIKLVNDASSAGPRSCMVVAMPGAAVKSIKDMAGKSVAVTARNTISDLLVMSTLKTNGIDINSIKWVEMPFPVTADRLKAGDMDTAFLTEPFLTGAQKNVGAIPVFDTAVGPTADMPTAGYGALAKFVNENPNTLAAFQRVMKRATDEAQADRTKVEPLLVEYSKIDPDTAKLATLLTFQSKLDPSRIQRVPDLMLEFGVIKEKIDVAEMIAYTESAS